MTLFRRASAQRIVYKRRGLIGIEFVKIANGFLADCGRRIVERLCNLVKRIIEFFREDRITVASLNQFFCRAPQRSDVFSPTLVIRTHSISMTSPDETPAASASGGASGALVSSYTASGSTT